MATSVSRIQAQIAKLQQQADALKQAALKRVQREIELHGLTSEDLFGASGATSSGRQVKSASTKPASKKGARSPKYGDGAGNTWGGMGKRPQWLKDALGNGASIEEFLLGQQVPAKSDAAAPSRARNPKAAVKRKGKAAAKPAPAAKSSRAQPGAKKAAAGKRKSRASAPAPAAEAAE